MMIKIDRSELKDLEYIGSGTFGTVYKKDDKTAYKIYHITVKDSIRGIGVYNPCFTLSKVHYSALLSRSKKLKYSGGIKDFIYVDGMFGGVKIPYYEGTTLDKLLDKPLKLKIELSNQIIRNCKELTGKLIYPTDYKLNNIVLCNDEIKLIDLDDKRTQVSLTPNPIIRSYSINALGETIQTLLKMYNHHPIPLKVAKKITRNKSFYSFRYNKIEEYLNNMKKEKNIIFINKESDIQKLKELINNNDFKIVYIINDKCLEEEPYLELINKFKLNNIELYDFITTKKIEDYSSIENINESYLLSSKELKKVPQRIK